MAWYPGAIRKNIPPGSTDPVIIPIGIIYHVRAGTGPSLFNYFNGPSGGIESHWYIRFDGTVEQYRDSAREADANRMANSFVINGKRYGFHSVETEGREHGEWTAAQIASLKSLTLWDSKIHGWPLRVAPAWNKAGVGYHVMFGAPGPWTPVAKSCPGPDRVRQFRNVFVPWLNSNHELPDTGTPEKDWFDMATKADLVQAVIEGVTAVADSGTEFKKDMKQIAADGTALALTGDQGQTWLVHAERVGLHGLLKEAAESSTATGRQVRDYIRAIVKETV